MQIFPIHLYNVGLVNSNKKSIKNKRARNVSSQYNFVPYYLPVFKSNGNKDNVMHIDLYDDTKKPYFSVEIAIKRPFPVKQGITPLYEIALRNKMNETKKCNKKWQGADAYVGGYAKKLGFLCDKEDLEQITKQVKQNFIKTNFTDAELKYAKELTKMAYELSLHNACKEYDFQDIPNNMTPDEYNKLIDSITLDDLKKYNNDILNNSDLTIVLQMNRKLYNENKNEILPILEKIYER